MFGRKRAIIRYVTIFAVIETSRVTKTRSPYRPTSLGHLLGGGLYHLVQTIQTYGRENVQPSPFKTTPTPSGLERAWFAQDLDVKQTVIDWPDAVDYAACDCAPPSKVLVSLPIPSWTDWRTVPDAAIAQRTGIRYIIAGVCRTDLRLLDCRDFVKSMNVTLNLAMDYANPNPPMVCDQRKLGRWRTNGRAGLHPRTDPHLLQRHRRRCRCVRVMRRRRIFGK